MRSVAAPIRLAWPLCQVNRKQGGWGGTEQHVVGSSPDGLPPHLTGTEHDGQMGGLSHVRCRRSQRKGDQNVGWRKVKPAYKHVEHHLLIRSSPKHHSYDAPCVEPVQGLL